MTQRAWLQRTWRFDLPVDLAPSLVERLRGTPARLEEAVHGVPSERLTSHAGGGWSIQEHVGHLLDLERLPRVRLQELLAGAEVLTAADMSNRATDEARHDQRPIAALLAGFRSARTALVARLDELAPEEFARAARHPRLEQPMRVIDLCLFHADHDDHHLARMRELLRDVPASTAAVGEE